MSRRGGARASGKVREWLIEIRTERGMTQGQVAAAAGIAQPSYFEIEKGISTPKPETAQRIGAELGFPWTRFFEKSDDVDAFEEGRG